MSDHWPRWIKASCMKHFDSLRQTIPLYMDGMDRDTARLRDFAEFRMDGPRTIGQSMNEVMLIVTINILVQHTMNDNDAYGFERLMGVFRSAFTEAIDAYRYGTGPADDQSYLGCLIRQNEIKYSNFGIVDATTRAQQGTLEAKYVLELTEAQ